MKTYSPTRWWRKWELMQFVMTHFADVESVYMMLTKMRHVCVLI